jgi:cytochrome c-type biogenesis protein CcmF
MPIGAALPWKRGDLAKVMSKLWIAAVFAFLIGIAFWAFRTENSIWPPLFMALAFWAILGPIVDLAERVKMGRAPFAESMRRLGGLPRSAWGQAVAHIGMGVTAFGIVGISAWSTEDIRAAKAGEIIPLSGYEIRFDGVERSRGPNYRTDEGRFTVMRDGREIATLVSEKRFYPVQRTQTTEAGIRASLVEDIYIVLGDRQDDGGWAVRSHVKPFANWIWIGALIMTLGGVLSLTDRRHRVGAPTRTKVRETANAVPAE